MCIVTICSTSRRRDESHGLSLDADAGAGLSDGVRGGGVARGADGAGVGVLGVSVLRRGAVGDGEAAMSDTEQKPKAKRPVLKVAPARVLVDTDSWRVSLRVFGMPSALGKYWKGKKQSASHCLAKSIALKGRQPAASTRAAVAEANRRRVHSPETRAKLSAASLKGNRVRWGRARGEVDE